MQLTVIGTGYLGFTHAVCMAELGHDVLAIDVDREKIAKAERAEVPFFEPGLEPLLRKNLDAGRLRFTTRPAEVGEFGAVHFLCVGTPQGTDGAADLSYLRAAVDGLEPYLTGRCLIVGKSRPGRHGSRGPGAGPVDGAGRRGGRTGLESGVPARGTGRAGQPRS
jgi:UDPglucose 6-dehydrogenase